MRLPTLCPGLLANDGDCTCVLLRLAYRAPAGDSYSESSVADSRSASCVLCMDETDDQPSVLGDTGPLGLGEVRARQRALPRGDLANLVRRLQRSRPSTDAPTTRCSRMRTAGDPEFCTSASAARIFATSAHGTCASPLRAPVAFAL